MFVSLRIVVSAAALAACAVAAQANPFDSYFDTGLRIDMPAIGVGSFGTSGSVLADGRIIAATGNNIYLESAVGTGTFDLVAAFDPSQTGGAVDPAFLRVSPGGERIAVGGGFGKPVAVFSLEALGQPGAPSELIHGVSATYFSTEHYDAAWLDETSLALTAGAWGQPSYVSLLDTTSDPLLPTNPIIVNNIGGSPAGIVFDASGYLYTGNGFAGSGPSDTGHVKAIAPDLWQAGLGGNPADFESQGTFIVDLLSASSLGFDAAGNFFVGGGDFFSGDLGYFALVNADALADALAEIAAIEISDPAQVRLFDPQGLGFATYSIAYNAVTSELYAGWADGFSAGDPVTWAVYAIPAPGSVSALLMLAAAGVFAERRRNSNV